MTIFSVGTLSLSLTTYITENCLPMTLKDSVAFSGEFERAQYVDGVAISFFGI